VLYGANRRNAEETGSDLTRLTFYLERYLLSSWWL